MENAKPNISPRRGMTPLERAWAAERNQRRHYGEHSQAGARLPDH